ncbi:MAG: DUF2752 domain-containing protein [Lachnospiraceae bacterium]|nr:DUF2752 domain-containing protein [Lachnospiraceae bacterium]
MLIAFLCLVAWIAYPFFPGLFGSGDCRFKEVTGFYCPGCGGTRAVRAFLSGHLIKSFIYHPFVPYCFFMWILYEGSHILEMLHVPHVKGMKFRSGYAYAGVIILFANFVIKNILLYVINHR